MPVLQRLDDESLRTLLREVESVINGRPLTYISTCFSEVKPQTPGHLLFLRGAAGPIPGNFSEADSMSRRRWRYVQYLAKQFWSRCRNEYLLFASASEVEAGEQEPEARIHSAACRSGHPQGTLADW